MESAVIKQRVADCEEAYLEIFCSKGREWGLYVYQDRKLPDSRRHNFIRIPDHIPPMQYKSLADVARNTARATGRRFLQLHMPSRIEFKRAQMETVGWYAQDTPLSDTADALPLRKFIAADAELLTAFALAQDDEGQGEDFARRKIERKMNAYLEADDLDCWLAMEEDALSAYAELFVYEGCARIALYPAATCSDAKRAALVAALSAKAREQGADMVYLSLDTEDPLTAGCQALGFEQCGEYYTVLWYFD